MFFSRSQSVPQASWQVGCWWGGRQVPATSFQAAVWSVPRNRGAKRGCIFDIIWSLILRTFVMLPLGYCYFILLFACSCISFILNIYCSEFLWFDVYSIWFLFKNLWTHFSNHRNTIFNTHGTGQILAEPGGWSELLGQQWPTMPCTDGEKPSGVGCCILLRNLWNVRPISCWAPMSQTSMAAAWATCWGLGALPKVVVYMTWPANWLDWLKIAEGTYFLHQFAVPGFSEWQVWKVPITLRDTHRLQGCLVSAAISAMTTQNTVLLSVAVAILWIGWLDTIDWYLFWIYLLYRWDNVNAAWSWIEARWRTLISLEPSCWRGDWLHLDLMYPHRFGGTPFNIIF